MSRFSNSSSTCLTPGNNSTEPFLNVSGIQEATLFMRFGNSALILLSSQPADCSRSVKICGSVIPPVLNPSRLTSRPYRSRIAATRAVSGGQFTSVPSTSKRIRRFTNILYAFLLGLAFGFSRKLVRIIRADDVARLRAVGGPDDTALFQEVHEPRGACVADTELALKVRSRRLARFDYRLFRRAVELVIFLVVADHRREYRVSPVPHFRFAEIYIAV